ncbi:MAG: glycosyltransferase [Acidobacteria bacterium]|nr:glycosyltransferase [Acidobacteriota bacterium]
MTRKPRVSVISLKWDGVSYYRGFMPFEELDDQGLIEFVDNRKLLESDVVVLERIFLPAHFALIAELKQRGKRLIYQIDDDPFNVPPYHPSYQVYQQREVKEGLFHTLRSVDRIIAATAPLKSILQQRLGGKVPISVIGNYLDFKSAWNPNRFASTLPLYRRPDKIVIGWSGALGHQADLQLLQGVFEELVRVYQDRLLFRFLGHHPEFVAAEALPGQVEMYSWVDVHSYPETLYSLALDIGLIPLVDNAHNRSKTLLKFLEYSALPIPSVISRVGPYQAVPADCGLLVENKFGKWVQAIKRLIDGAPEREALRRRAHEHVKASFDIADHTAPWLEAILSVKPDLSKAAFTVPCHSSADVLPDSVDIIVPIHDAFAETRSCLESVLAHTDLTRHRLLLVNDGSTDSRMAPFLEQLVENVSGRNIVLVQHTEAQGFIKSCNEAMRLGRQDVVLLNSDTMVSARWLDKLRECAYANPSVGTVTPLSTVR